MLLMTGRGQEISSWDVPSLFFSNNQSCSRAKLSNAGATNFMRPLCHVAGVAEESFFFFLFRLNRSKFGEWLSSGLQMAHRVHALGAQPAGVERCWGAHQMKPSGSLGQVRLFSKGAVAVQLSSAPLPAM